MVFVENPPVRTNVIVMHVTVPTLSLLLPIIIEFKGTIRNRPAHAGYK